MIWRCAALEHPPLSSSAGSRFRSSNNLLTSPECPEDSTAEAESEDDITASQTSLEKPTPHRGNTMVHVCWHRNTSVSMVDFSVAVEVPAQRQNPDLLLPSCLTVFFLCVCVLFLDSLLIMSPWEQYPPVLHLIMSATSNYEVSKNALLLPCFLANEVTQIVSVGKSTSLHFWWWKEATFRSKNVSSSVFVCIHPVPFSSLIKYFTNSVVKIAVRDL